jgi:hypothetical protein
LSILLVVVFAALNPAQRLQDTNNARRWSDVNQVLSSIHQCIIDNNGVTTDCLGNLTDGTMYEIVGTGTVAGCNAVCGVADAADCADLEATLVSADPQYIARLPIDPIGAADGHTSYAVTVNGGIVTVSACSAQGETIEVSR